MFFYFIPLILIIVSLTIVVFIVVKKFSSLAVINIESVPKEKESKVRNRIMTERLVRKFSDFKKATNDFFQPVIIDIGSAWSKFYQNVMDIEKKNLPEKKSIQKIDIKQEITEKIAQANKLLAEEEFEKAEEICISMLELDDKNTVVYELLTTIYIESKEYQKALETCDYLSKLLAKTKDKHALANCYVDLGYIYQLDNKNKQALINFKKAVNLEPSNPRFLDSLTKISIILKDKKLAEQAFSSLKKADSENQKLSELKEEIDNI